MKIRILEDGVLVSQATKSGFIFCKYGGVVDLGYPESKNRRGRVQSSGDICPAITSSTITIYRVEVSNEQRI